MRFSDSSGLNVAIHHERQPQTGSATLRPVTRAVGPASGVQLERKPQVIPAPLHEIRAPGVVHEVEMEAAAEVGWLLAEFKQRGLLEGHYRGLAVYDRQ